MANRAYGGRVETILAGVGTGTWPPGNEEQNASRSSGWRPRTLRRPRRTRSLWSWTSC